MNYNLWSVGTMRLTGWINCLESKLNSDVWHAA